MAKRASKAVNSGPAAMMTSTLATLVKVSASMKAVNITLQQTPETQNAREAGRTPQWRSRRPCPAGTRTRYAKRCAVCAPARPAG